MSSSNPSERAMQHILEICAAGPRPAGSEAERRAAEYVRAQLAAAGISDVRTQEFPAPPSAGWRSIPAAALAAGGLALSGGGRWSKLLGGTLALTGGWLLHQTLRGRSPLPAMGEMGMSQNVIARIPARSDTRFFLTLVAQIDSGRSGPAAPEGMLRSLRWVNTIALALTGLASVSMLWDGLIGRRESNLLQRLGVLAGASVLGAFIADDRMRQPSQGANDNASGIGVALALAEQISAEPFEHTEVVLLFTGAGHVFSDGINAYLDRFAPPKDFSAFIDLSGVGAGDLIYAARQGLSAFSDVRATPQMAVLAAATARRHPELRVSGHDAAILSDGAVLAQRGYESITISAIGHDGVPLQWNRALDNVIGLDSQTLASAVRYVMALAQATAAKFGT